MVEQRLGPGLRPGRDQLQQAFHAESLGAHAGVPSAAPQDVTNAYQRHANAYVTKPVNLADFEHAVRSIDEFFLNIASPVPRS